jgi:hypothetical protein
MKTAKRQKLNVPNYGGKTATLAEKLAMVYFLNSVEMAFIIAQLLPEKGEITTQENVLAFHTDENSKKILNMTDEQRCKTYQAALNPSFFEVQNNDD